MPPRIADPLTGPPPEEVPLERAPLVSVLAQVRFPAILALRTGTELASRFQELIRERHPVLSQDQAQNIVVTPGKPAEIIPEPIWRFGDIDDEWKVSLASDFISLETTRYTSRNDFLRRFEEVLSAAEESFHPKVMTRIGLRYIDRLEGEVLERLDELLRPEVVGIVATPLRGQMGHSMTESLFRLAEASIMLRSGLLPEGATIDPGLVEPVPRPSFILDLDMFREGRTPFQPADLAATAQGFAERIYTVFRWSVTEEFLAYYGGGS